MSSLHEEESFKLSSGNPSGDSSNDESSGEQTKINRKMDSLAQQFYEEGVDSPPDLKKEYGMDNLSGITHLMKYVHFSKKYPHVDGQIEQICRDTPNEINKRASNGFTALMFACGMIGSIFPFCSQNTIEILHKYGAVIEPEDEEKIFFALVGSCSPSSIVKKIINRMSNITKKSYKFLIQRLIFSYGVNFGVANLLDIIRHLIKKNMIDINKKIVSHEKEGKIALLKIAHEMHLEAFCCFLIKNGAIVPTKMFPSEIFETNEYKKYLSQIEMNPDEKWEDDGNLHEDDTIIEKIRDECFSGFEELRDFYL